MDSPTLIIFPNSGSQGRDLALALEKLGQSLGFETVVLWEGTREQHFAACYCATAVVVDASIEPGCEDVYRIVAVLPNVFSHVLTVSRTYVPLNFVPSRPGGVPRYPYPDVQMPDGQILKGLEGYRWGNSDILKWSEDELRRILAAPGSRLPFEILQDLENAREAILQMMKEAIGDRITRGDPPRRVFLSYRGKNYDAVAALARRIETGEFHGGETRAVRLIQPGELAHEKEFLSEGRRWMLVSLLDDELRACDELWVCRRPGDDYLQSWWTLSELVMASYIRDDNNPGVRISVFDLDHGERTDGAEYVVSLTDDQRRLFARFLQRPDTMSPENTSTIRLQRWAFRLGLGKLMLSQFEKMMDHPALSSIFAAAPTDQEREEIRKVRFEPEWLEIPGRCLNPAKASRRGRQDRQNQQALFAGVADAVGDPFGRDEHHPRLHGLLAVFKEERAAPGEHVVDLAHARVRMEPVLLAGLEGVEFHEQALGLTSEPLYRF